MQPQSPCRKEAGRTLPSADAAYFDFVQSYILLQQLQADGCPQIDVPFTVESLRYLRHGKLGLSKGFVHLVADFEGLL